MVDSRINWTSWNDSFCPLVSFGLAQTKSLCYKEVYLFMGFIIVNALKCYASVTLQGQQSVSLTLGAVYLPKHFQD